MLDKCILLDNWYFSLQILSQTGWATFLAGLEKIRNMNENQNTAKYLEFQLLESNYSKTNISFICFIHYNFYLVILMLSNSLGFIECVCIWIINVSWQAQPLHHKTFSKNIFHHKRPKYSTQKLFLIWPQRRLIIFHIYCNNRILRLMIKCS